MAGVLLLSLSFPTLFLYGVRRHAGGFEFRTVLRRPKSIEYSAIAQIDAVVRRDGDMGFAFVDLIIRTPQHSVRIPEGLLSEAGLIAELKKLPGFNAETFALAESYEPTGLSELFPKRFRVFPTA